LTDHFLSLWTLVEQFGWIEVSRDINEVFPSRQRDKHTNFTLSGIALDRRSFPSLQEHQYGHLTESQLGVLYLRTRYG
jgi:hypothetical protein